MMKFFNFICFRYCDVISHISAFFAGVCLVVPVAYMSAPLLVAVVAGSAAAFFKRKYRNEEMRELAARIVAEIELSDRGSD